MSSGVGVEVSDDDCRPPHVGIVFFVDGVEDVGRASGGVRIPVASHVPVYAIDRERHLCVDDDGTVG